MKRIFALLPTVGLLVLVLPTQALAAPVDVTTVLERRIQADDTPPGVELYQAVLDFTPGAWTPLHSHTGASYNTVLAGEVTLHQDGVDRTFSAGEGWVDDPGILHAAGNQSNADARLIASFVVRPGVPPSTIVPPIPGAVVPPRPTTVAFFKLNAPELAQSLEVIHQVVNLGSGATLPLTTASGPRIVSVLDGSVTTDQDGEPQEYLAGDSWAEFDASVADPDPIAGETGAQVVTTMFVPRGELLSAPAVALVP